MAPNTVFSWISPWGLLLDARDFLGVWWPCVGPWDRDFFSSIVFYRRRTSHIVSKNAPKMGFGRFSKTTYEWRDGYVPSFAQDPAIYSALRPFFDRIWRNSGFGSCVFRHVDDLDIQKVVSTCPGRRLTNSFWESIAPCAPCEDESIRTSEAKRFALEAPISPREQLQAILATAH